MSRKALVRAASIIVFLLGLWVFLGGPVPFLKVSGLTPIDATFDGFDPDDIDTDRGGMIDASGTDRSDEREFVGEEYDPDRERKIDEMIENAEEQEQEDWDNDE